MKDLLLRLQKGGTLTYDEACAVILDLREGKTDNIQLGAMLALIGARGVTVDELLGFREGLKRTCLSVDLSAYDPIDIVGTGGDGKNTFNISTCSCFVVAGAGYYVAKQGNFGATSISGASNVIQAHGVKFTADESKLRESIEKSKVAYLHCQLFHPAMKNAAPVRKALGIPTVFNLLGPIVNPASPRHQMLGVANLTQMRLYHNALKRLGMSFAIVTSIDGYDEISLTDDFKVMTDKYETVYSLQDLGLEKSPAGSLSGGKTVEEAKEIFDAVLENRGTKPRTMAVIYNSAFALQILSGKSIEECIAMAEESLKSGKALAALKKFVEVNS